MYAKIDKNTGLIVSLQWKSIRLEIMAIEIERKFLVNSASYRNNSVAHKIAQGYICVENDRVVRVRVKDNKAYLTIKNATIGFSRNEYEYEIPVEDALAMLENTCIQPVIDKTRYVLKHGQHVWEVDEFHRENEGLVVAEIELSSEQEEFEIPDFVGKEVTGIMSYYNAMLINKPYCEWQNK